MRHLPVTLFVVYSLVALVGLDFSVFARWNVFSEIRPRLIWYDLRAKRAGETVFFSRDYAPAYRQNTIQSWRVWRDLQKMGPNTHTHAENEIQDLGKSFREICDCTDLEIVKIYGRLGGHLYKRHDVTIESVLAVP